MRMRRFEESLLHGPWEDADAPEDVELAALRADYGHRWRIWRGMSEHQVAGSWHAVAPDPSGSLRGLRAETAHALRRCLRQAEEER